MFFSASEKKEKKTNDAMYVNEKNYYFKNVRKFVLQWIANDYCCVEMF